MMPREFDVGEFARTARGSLRDELDLASLGATPLAADVVTVLEALRRARGSHHGAPAQRARHAHPQGRPSHGVPRDLGVREVLDRRRARRRSSRRAAAARRRPGRPHGCPQRPRRGIRRARGPVRRAFAGFTQGESIVGAHTAARTRRRLGARRRLRAQCRRPAPAAAAHSPQPSTTIIARRRHGTPRFFDEESRRRLVASPRAARLARRELRRSPWPLGAAVDRSATRRRAVARFTWSGAGGAERLASLERRIAELPGIGPSAAAAVRASLARDASD